MRPARSLSSATVVAVIVFIGGWSNVTWQYLDLRQSTLKCVRDRDHSSQSRALSDGPVSIVIPVDILSYIRDSVADEDCVLFVHVVSLSTFYVQLA